MEDKAQKIKTNLEWKSFQKAALGVMGLGAIVEGVKGNTCSLLATSETTVKIKSYQQSWDLKCFFFSRMDGSPFFSSVYKQSKRLMRAF